MDSIKTLTQTTNTHLTRLCVLRDTMNRPKCRRRQLANDSEDISTMERRKYETITSNVCFCFGEACARTCVGVDLPWYRSDVEHGERVESSIFALHYHGRTYCYHHCLAHITHLPPPLQPSESITTSNSSLLSTNHICLLFNRL